MRHLWFFALVCLSCHGEPQPTAALGGCASRAALFARTVWEPVLSYDCLGCHVEGGLAQQAGAHFLLQAPSRADYMTANLISFTNTAARSQPGKPLLLLKPSAKIPHGGGKRFTQDSASYQAIEAFLQAANLADSCAPAFSADAMDYAINDSPARTLRRAALLLAGRLPTPNECAAAERGDIAAGLDGVLADPAVGDFAKRVYNDVLLVSQYAVGRAAIEQVPEKVFPSLRWFGTQPEAAAHVNEALATMPLELIAHVVRTNAPLTEILTANYVMVNAYSAASLLGTPPPAPGAASTAAFVPAILPQWPTSGVLTHFSTLNAITTSDTNRNRKRARMVYGLFLNLDILNLARRTLVSRADLTDAGTPTMQNPSCVSCHRLLDPVAGCFQNWDGWGQYTRQAWFTDMFPPGFASEPLPAAAQDHAVGWLAEKIAHDERFLQATVSLWLKALTGRAPVTEPDVTDPAFKEDAAYDTAHAIAQHHAPKLAKLADTFATSHYNVKALIKAIVLSPYFRTRDIAPRAPATDAALVASYGHAQRRGPEDMHLLLQALLPPCDFRDKLISNLNTPFGGLDGREVSRRNPDTNGLIANLGMALAAQVSRAALEEFQKPAAARLLFPYVSLDDLSTQDKTSVMRNLQYLHARLLGENLAIDHVELQHTRQLLDQTWATSGSMQQAWMAVLTYLLADFDFLYD